MLCTVHHINVVIFSLVYEMPNANGCNGHRFPAIELGADVKYL